MIAELGYNYWDDGVDYLANKYLLYRIEHALIREQIGVGLITVEIIENRYILILTK